MTTTQRTTAKRLTVLVRDLCAGDVFTTAKGERLTVRSVDAFGACAIVDFTDGTATPPVLALSQVAIDRPVFVHPRGARVVKCVDWSYPTSTNAQRFGCAGIGCWTVNLTTIDGDGDNCETRAVSGGYATETEAVRAAVTYSEPWASWARVCQSAQL